MMGIPGLTTFVDENPHLLTDHQLHDTRLVIDGNNLYYFLYYYFHVNHQYGGDYDHFSQAVKYFFKTLNICNVTPFVVFDGGYDADDRKLQTTLRRMRERRHLAGFISQGMRGKVLPILACETFKDVLNSLCIKHVTCDFEADDQVAALANEWNCPVLSNDSDFFIYDLNAGFILIDYFNLKIKEHTDENDPSISYFYLNVQMYHINTFLKLFKGIERNILPLFATLIGNDFVDSKVFQPFFSQVKLPKPHSKRLLTRRNSHMISLLFWLESQQNVEDAVISILKFYKKDEREKIKKTIHTSINAYTSLSCHFLKYIMEENDGDVSYSSSLKTYFGGNSMPSWFVKRVREGNVPIATLNAINLHRVMLLCQVENMDELSGYSCSVTLRAFMYGVLLSLDKDLCTNYPKKDTSRKTHIEEYDRERKDLKKRTIEPLFMLPDPDLQFPGLLQIPEISMEHRRLALLSILGIDPSLLDGIKPELHLPFCVVFYWVMHACPKVGSQHLQAVLVCMIKMSFIDRSISSGRSFYVPALGQISDSDDTDEEMMMESESCYSVEDCEKAHERLQKFQPTPKHNNACKLDVSVLHAFAQFHACLRDAMYLNQVLLVPLHNSKPAEVFNGTFLYNFSKELHSRKYPDLYIQEQLGRDTHLAAVYRNLHGLLMGAIPPERFITADEAAYKKSKKRSRKVNVSAQDVMRQSTNDEPCEKLKQFKLTLDASCALNNKFGALCVSDDDSD